MSNKNRKNRNTNFSDKQREQARQNKADEKRELRLSMQQSRPEAEKADPADGARPMPETAPEADLAQREEKLREGQQELEKDREQLQNERQQLESDKKAAEEKESGLNERERELNRRELLQDSRQAALDAQEAELDNKIEQLVEQQKKWLEKRQKLDDELTASKMTIQQKELAERMKRMNEADADLIVYEKNRREAIEKEINDSRAEQTAQLKKDLSEKLQAWESQKAEERKALDAEHDENERTRQDLNAFEEKLDERQKQLEQKEREKTNAIRAKEEKCQELQRALSAAQQTADLLRTRVDERDKKLAAYQSFESAWNGDPETLKQELTELRSEKDLLRQKLNERPPKDLQEKYDALLQEKNAESEKNGALEARLKEQQYNAEELRRLRETEADREVRIQKAELDAQVAQKQRDELQAQLDRLLRPEAKKQDRDERIAALSVPYLTNIPEQKKEQPKDEIEWLQDIQNECRKYDIVFPRRLLYAFHTAMKIADWSSITILSGISGTGKSELPRLYSLFGGINFCSVPVQPNWDSQESMLGYFNSIDNRFEAKELLRFLVQCTNNKSETGADGKKHLKLASEYPWPLGQYMSIVLLDEMNLAHVEHYFAEFLSKLETRRGLEKGDVPTIDVNLGAGCEPYKLPLRRNVLWVGTMNQDETTKTLSDKVLDRGITITFPTPKKLESRPEMKKLPDKVSDHMLGYWTWYGWCRSARSGNQEFRAQMDKYRCVIEKINEQMGKSGRAVGHRVWQSIEYYITNYPDVIAERKALLEPGAMDAAKQQAGEEKTERRRIEECDLEKADTPLSPRLAQAMDIAFEDQLVQKIMPKLRGIEDNGSGRSQLDAIWTILEDAGFGALKDDFEKARQYGYGEFFWNSAEYLEHELPIAQTEPEAPDANGQA